MGFNNILKAFLPKDKVFYTLFEKVAANLTEMSNQFRAAMEEPNSVKRKSLLRGLEDGEHKNDDLTHQIFIELGQNFITPFDREDIHSLAMALDDVADYMDSSSKKMINYQVEEPDEFMRNMAVIIQNSIGALSRAVHELRNMKKLREITEACVAINSFENQADDLLDKGLIRLFTELVDAIELIKLKEIYQDMEIITDKCEDAANVIESIIIKYS
jgi:predicted phosphate transport protein (TIGR00153 family)